MSKHIQVKDLSTGRKDRYMLVSDIGGSSTEVKIATAAEAQAGTDAGALVTAKGLATVVGAPMGATITVGAEGTNTVLVTIQLTDATGADMAVSAGVLAYISDNADGSTIAATAPNGGWAITTDGLLIPIVANKAACRNPDRKRNRYVLCCTCPSNWQTCH
jgi:hypothetical protein